MEAYVAAVVAMLIFAVPASIQQQRYSPIQKDPPKGLKIDGAGLHRRRHSDRRAGREHHRQCEISGACFDTVPVLGLAVWAVILLTAGLRAPDW